MTDPPFYRDDLPAVAANLRTVGWAATADVVDSLVPFAAVRCNDPGDHAIHAACDGRGWVYPESPDWWHDVTRERMGLAWVRFVELVWRVLGGDDD